MRSRPFLNSLVWLLVSAFLITNFLPRLGFFDRDAAAYSYLGQRIFSGDVPYRDLWDHKPPGIFYWDALLAGFGLNTPAGLVCIEAVLIILTVLAVWFTARTLFGTGRANVAAILYASIGTNPYWRTGPNMSESMLALPVVAAYWIVVRRLDRSRRQDWALAGFLIGLAALVKQPALLDGLVLAGVCLWLPKDRRGRLAAMALGGALPIATTMMVLACQGALPAAYDQIILYNTIYLKTGVPGAVGSWSALGLLFIMSVGPVAMMALGAAVLGRYPRYKSRGRVVVLLWLAAALVEGLVAMRPSSHYFIPLFAPLTILAASLPTAKPRSYLLMAIGISAILIGLQLRIILPALSSPAMMPSTLGTRQEAVDLAEWVNGCTAGSDTIYVWGAESSVYLDAERRAASRYFYNYPLIDRFGEITGDGYGGPERWAELAGDLKRNPPQVVAIAPTHEIPAGSPLESFLDDGYRTGPSFGEWRTFVPTGGRCESRSPNAETRAGWNKAGGSPLLGGKLGVLFDVAVLDEGGRYRMWVSWRSQRSIALSTSEDGLRWTDPEIVLEPKGDSGWENVVNRPTVVRRPDGYHMWYTGQTSATSRIGYATSPDGRVWTRISKQPVLSPTEPWEKRAVMCPHVLWDEEKRLFEMWYSGGEQYEPDAIGYATSTDGLTWEKRREPIFKADPARRWESQKVTASTVVRHGGEYLMFYIGFRDSDHARIGLARSQDGITNWERHPDNPIISPARDPAGWDHDAVYKPAVQFDGRRWLLWYNGRRGSVEQIGLAIHEGEDLGFPQQ